MRLGRGTRLVLRAQSAAILLLLLALAALAAWASVTWQTRADWTFGQRNSLTAASRKLLTTLAEPVTITAFVPPHTALAAAERMLLARYHAADSRIRVRLVNPDLVPAEVQRLGITTAGELYVSYGRRGEKLDDVSESGITNALLRLSRAGRPRVVFTSGHGEADPRGKRNFDLGRFGDALAGQGFDLVTQNLAKNPVLAHDTALVVIAGAQQAFLPGEVAVLLKWVDHGGNLLWLHNPGPLNGLGPLAKALGVKALDGTIVDETSSTFGVNDPTALVITHYGASPVTQDFRLNTLFPDATGFEVAARSNWQTAVFVKSRPLPASWLVTGGLRNGTILYRPATDVAGPVPIAIALSRPSPAGVGEQHAAVVGDADFLANSYLANGGNLNLGLNLFNWLSNEDRYIDISPVQAPDRTLSLSRAEQGGIGFGFLAGLPLLFLGAAVGLWLRRRRR